MTRRALHGVTPTIQLCWSVVGTTHRRPAIDQQRAASPSWSADSPPMHQSRTVTSTAHRSLTTLAEVSVTFEATSCPRRLACSSCARSLSRTRAYATPRAVPAGSPLLSNRRRTRQCLVTLWFYKQMRLSPESAARGLGRCGTPRDRQGTGSVGQMWERSRCSS